MIELKSLYIHTSFFSPSGNHYHVGYHLTEYPASQWRGPID